jgi:hypothetical protein
VVSYVARLSTGSGLSWPISKDSSTTQSELSICDFALLQTNPQLSFGVPMQLLVVNPDNQYGNRDRNNNYTKKSIVKKVCRDQFNQSSPKFDTKPVVLMIAAAVADLTSL